VADVNAGGASTVRVKVCDALGCNPLSAWIVRVYTPLLPDAGVPVRSAVPVPVVGERDAGRKPAVLGERRRRGPGRGDREVLDRSRR